MSARAAWRLESLGFTEVFRYTAGKADWFANGLPRAGQSAEIPRAGDIARSDVSTCRLNDRVGDIRSSVWAAGAELCVVVNDERVVLGLVRKENFDADPLALIERIMDPGPTTFRPSESLERITEYMQKHGSDSVLITTSEGRLVGLLHREDVERVKDVPAAVRRAS